MTYKKEGMNGTKNFSLNKRNNYLLKIFIGATALLFFLIILNFFSVGIRNVFYSLSSPIEKSFWSAGESVAGFFGSFLKAGSLSKENENLKSENQKLLSEIIFLQTITNSNQAQTIASLACQNSDFELLMASVIGLDNQDMLTINKGSADGILEGMPVIGQESALFGKIFKVYENYSKVMLISDKNSVINVKVKPDDPAQERVISGVVKGKGGLDIFLDLVPIDDTINEGDTLVTSSLEGTFPKDLLVGKITSIKKNDQDPHQQAEVQPFLNINANNLFVITNYKR